MTRLPAGLGNVVKPPAIAFHAGRLWQDLPIVTGIVDPRQGRVRRSRAGHR